MINPVLEKMLDKYSISTQREMDRAIREILQEICLVGMWRAKFFEAAAFYGDTALRILYGLDRFSKDLDFTLLKPNPDFSWAPFANTIKTELQSYGFSIDFTLKKKAFDSPIQSAFLKTDTHTALLKVGIPEIQTRGIHPSAKLKIKVEVDTDPTMGFVTNSEFLQFPLPIAILTLCKEDLFASKLHAALFRAWKNRVKGRDWYDVVWYIRSAIPVRLSFFIDCLKKNGTHPNPDALTPDLVRGLILERVDHLDLESAIEDMNNFVNEANMLSLWDRKFIEYWIKKIKFI